MTKKQVQTHFVFMYDQTIPIMCCFFKGCTVVIGMEMMTYSLLPPMIIFSGGFGKTLMKKWEHHKESTVLFTDNHWMTESTTMKYLHNIRLLFLGKRIGVIYDHAPSHTERLAEWVATSTVLITGKYIDPCLTSIYQPCDIVIIKVFKGILRRLSTDLIFSRSLRGSWG
jgi:hypothetical protein